MDLKFENSCLLLSSQIRSYLNDLSPECPFCLQFFTFCFQVVVRQSFSSCQAVIRQSSGSRQAGVRQSSDSRQAGVRQSSDSCLKVVRQLSMDNFNVWILFKLLKCSYTRLCLLLSPFIRPSYRSSEFCGCVWKEPDAHSTPM